MYSFGQLWHCLIISNNILHYLALFDIVKHRVGNSIFRSFQSLKKNDSDRIDLVDLLKRSTMIESLSSIFEKDWGERFDLFKYRIYLLITKNDRFDQKTDDRNPNPGKTLYSTVHYQSKSIILLVICCGLTLTWYTQTTMWIGWPCQWPMGSPPKLPCWA